MDMTAVSGAVTALRGAADIARAMIGMRDTTLIDTKVIELNQAIIGAQGQALDAQAAQMELIKEVERLSTRIIELLAWDKEAENYALTKLHDGALVQAYREKPSDLTPAHYLCANCFDRKTKSMLQEFHLTTGRSTVLVCNSCSAIIYTRGQAYPEHAPVLRTLVR